MCRRRLESFYAFFFFLRDFTGKKSLAQIFPVFPSEPDCAGDFLHLLPKSSCHARIQLPIPTNREQRPQQQGPLAQDTFKIRVLYNQAAPPRATNGETDSAPPAPFRRPEAGQIQVNLPNSTFVHAMLGQPFRCPG